MPEVRSQPDRLQAYGQRLLVIAKTTAELDEPGLLQSLLAPPPGPLDPYFARLQDARQQIARGEYSPAGAMLRGII